MSDRPAPLRITVPSLLLDGATAGDSFLHAHRELVIHADVVQIRHHYRLPGAHLRIFARRIEADGATLDLSGEPPSAHFVVDQVEPALAGTPAAPDGRAGSAGGRGGDGGRLWLFAGEIAGTLAVIAKGADGGNGQRGGDGVKPATPPAARDGKFTAHEPPSGEFGAKVVRAKGARWYWEQAYGETGANARPGGNAGAAGAGGDGGDGGQVCIRHLAPLAQAPATAVQGGAAGLAGVDAQPGPAGEPGQGGRHRLFQYHWVMWWGSRWEKYADDSDSDVRDIVAKFGIPARAQSGAPSTPGAPAAPPAPARPGVPGAVDVRMATAAELAAECDTRYLELLCDSAAADAARGQDERALARYQWVEALTRDSTDETSARLLARARAGINALTQAA